eukprot:TRINITY_DN9215_c0_g1_i1.p1 TRINITY_DN9215_c0_g1~~TRINITY_DN9215_c0_g1_i1.p1  ORF type:complete len:1234 (+),score=363.48 TRINITY_DN9215_c0_g1_i1:498-3704(+)
MSLLVEITKPGGHRDDKVFTAKPSWTLATVKEHVCNDDTERANTYFKAQPYREYSGGRLLSMAAASFQFRAYGFALPLPEDTNVRLAHMRKVLLVPERAAGLHLAEELDIDFLADVLTKLDHDDFAAINVSSLVGEQWRKESDAQTGPMQRITDRYNRCSAWIWTMVLTEEEVFERARIIEMLIELADKFSDLQNLHGTITIVACLAHPAIKRLKKTWALVETRLLHLFEILSKLLEPQNNRYIYRNKLKSIDKIVDKKLKRRQCKSPCMPFIGCFTGDILFCEEGNPDTIRSYEARGMAQPASPRDDMVLEHFFKFRGLARMLEQVREYQRNQYTIQHLPQASPTNVKYAQWFLDTFEALPKTSVFKISRQLEPTEDESETPAPEASDRIKEWHTNPANLDDIVETTASRRSFSSEAGTSSKERMRGPRIRYVDFFGIDGKQERHIARTMQAIRQSKPLEDKTVVTAQVSEDQLFVVVPETMALVLRRHLKDIDYYDIDKEHDLVYIYSKTPEGRKECHFFELIDAGSLEFYKLLNKHCRRFSKLMSQANEDSRTAAMNKLTDMEHPVADGAFVLRDSTSRPGCYALSVKHNSSVTHYLIERLEDKTLSVRDSDLAFDALRDLVVYYCLYQTGELPCLLNPTDSIFMTQDCPRFASNSLPLVTKANCKSVEDQPWYFGRLDRQKAEALLRRFNKPGMFLVRDSSLGDNMFALSVMPSASHAEVPHALMTHNGTTNKWQLDGKDCADTISDILALLSEPDQSWMPQTLTVTCPHVGTLAKPISEMIVAESSDGSQRVVRAKSARMAASETLRAPSPVVDKPSRSPLRKVTDYITLRKLRSSSASSSRSSSASRTQQTSNDSAISRGSPAVFRSPSSSADSLSASSSMTDSGTSITVSNHDEEDTFVLDIPRPHARTARVIEDLNPDSRQSSYSHTTVVSLSTSTIASNHTLQAYDSDRDANNGTPSADDAMPSTVVSDQARNTRIRVERRRSVDNINPPVPAQATQQMLQKRMQVKRVSSGHTMVGSEQDHPQASGQQTPTGSMAGDLEATTPTAESAFSSLRTSTLV